jgi:hypothetical protein
MSVHAFPVRLAETVNRFGAARAERATPTAPMPVLVTISGRAIVARALGERVSRRGRQTLVSVRGKRMWVASHRVQTLDQGVGLTA